MSRCALVPLELLRRPIEKRTSYYSIWQHSFLIGNPRSFSSTDNMAARVRKTNSGYRRLGLELAFTSLSQPVFLYFSRMWEMADKRSMFELDFQPSPRNFHVRASSLDKAAANSIRNKGIIFPDNDCGHVVLLLRRMSPRCMTIPYFKADATKRPGSGISLSSSRFGINLVRICFLHSPCLQDGTKMPHAVLLLLLFSKCSHLS
jgi:hypothetical protein